MTRPPVPEAELVIANAAAELRLAGIELDRWDHRALMRASREAA